jgi:hypothetical protein
MIKLITNNMEKTAVEWLEWLFKEGILIEKSFEIAKQKEKEHMHKCASFWRGKENEIEKPMFDEHYKRTYNK